ncbi:sodium:solute symporter [Bacillus sp. B190/17]|uniref:Sodium:solute symporter n=1 Tax=Bacillus lumedeiriae TaxID=3058829 RepID=A0ABW8IEB3_9BACI
MNISIFIIIGFLLISIYWAIRSSYSSKGQKMNMEQWALGGRGMGTLITFFLLAGEFFTTFSLTGLAGMAYFGGVSAYYFMCYIALGCALAYFILPFIRKYAQQNQLISQADFFSSKYKSPLLGVFVTLVGVTSMIPLMVIAFKGLGLIVSEASYGKISPSLAIWAGVISVVVYTTISGLHGSSRVALIKDILTFSVLAFIGLYLPFHYHGGIQLMFQSIQEIKPELLILPDRGMSISWFVSTVLFSTVGFYMWPNAFLSVFAAKSDQALRKNAIMMPFYSLLLLFSCLVGFVAVLQLPGLQGAAADLALLKLAIQTFDPWFVGIIGAAGLLCALVPCSIILITASTMLSKNIFAFFLPMTETQQAKSAKFLPIVLAFIALYFALHGGNTLLTIYLMGYSFITQLFPAFICSLFKNNFVTKQGAIAGMIAGMGTAAYVHITNTTIGGLFPLMPQFIKDINIGVFALAVNFLVMATVSVLTKRVPAMDEQSSQAG